MHCLTQSRHRRRRPMRLLHVHPHLRAPQRWACAAPAAPPAQKLPRRCAPVAATACPPPLAVGWMCSASRAAPAAPLASLQHRPPWSQPRPPCRLLQVRPNRRRRPAWRPTHWRALALVARSRVRRRAMHRRVALTCCQRRAAAAGRLGPCTAAAAQGPPAPLAAARSTHSHSSSAVAAGAGTDAAGAAEPPPAHRYCLGPAASAAVDGAPALALTSRHHHH